MTTGTAATSETYHSTTRALRKPADRRPDGPEPGCKIYLVAEYTAAHYRNIVRIHTALHPPSQAPIILCLTNPLRKK